MANLSFSISGLADWIQALSTVAIVVLSMWTLIVLRKYAADTKRIADASTSQTERSQMPFLAVAWRDAAQGIREGWQIQNQGFGPALNVRFSTYGEAGQGWRSIADIGVGENRDSFHNQIASCLQNQHGNRTFIIEYSSLSGQRYRTTVDRLPNGELQTQFHK